MTANEYLDILHSLRLATENLRMAHDQGSDSTLTLNALYYTQRTIKKMCDQAGAEGLDLDAAEAERNEVRF